METAQKFGSSIYNAGTALLKRDRSEPTMTNATIRFVGLHVVALGPPIINALMT